MPPDLVIGVDVGGTKMLAGVVARDGSVGRTIERPTSTAGQAALLEELDGLVADLLPEGSSAIGVGVPMNLDRRTGIGFGAVNLPLRSLDLAAHLQARFSIPVGVENDGNAIALAEWRVGAGQGANDLVALALGTGVGGSCHGHGHLEAVASGEAAERAAVELWGGGADAHRLVREAQDGHKAARSALSQIGHYLGAAIGSFANIFGPEVVVVGGGFGTAAWDFLSGPAEEAARREALHPADNELRIVQAALGDDAGLVGAGLVGFEALDGLR